MPQYPSFETSSKIEEDRVLLMSGLAEDVASIDLSQGNVSKVNPSHSVIVKRLATDSAKSFIELTARKNARFTV